MSPMKIFIAGSCVSRDPFSESNKDKFSIANYFARYSLARLSYPSIKMADIQLTDALLEQKVSSAFQRRILTQEWENALLEQVVVTDFDYLVIDCVDERFGLVECSPGIYITNSDELRNGKIINTQIANKLLPDSQEFQDRWEQGLRQLVTSVGSHRIIINNVFWSRVLDTGEGFEPISNPTRIKYCNAMVSKLYDIAKKYIPESQFVNYPPDIFVGDSNHKWGKSPFHYTGDVYDYFIKYLSEIK